MGLNICILSYRSNPFCGGQGVYVKYLSRALWELGHRVDIISGEPYPLLDKGPTLIEMPGMNFYGYKSTWDALKERKIRSGADLYEFISYNTGGFPEPRAFGMRTERYLLKRALNNYHIVHDNQSLSYGLVSISKRFPLVATIHHPITRDLKFSLKNEKNFFLRLLIRRWHSFLRMQKRVVHKIPFIITVSETAKKDIQEEFNIPEDKIFVVHNGVDFEKFKPVPEITCEPFRIITTASADVPLKGLNHLIEAIFILKKDFPKIHLRVIGSLKKGGKTEKLIKKYGLEKHISFLSGIDDIELVKEYARACVAVIPSLYEGFGFPAAEAMACAKPVVSTTGGALPEVVGDAGILIPPGDPKQMADAIAYVLSDPSLQMDMGTKARKRMIEKFSWNLAAKKTVEIYKKAIDFHVNH